MISDQLNLLVCVNQDVAGARARVGGLQPVGRGGKVGPRRRVGGGVVGDTASPAWLVLLPRNII